MIPHEQMLERSFVVTPLVELDSDLIHPITKTVFKKIRFPQDSLNCILSSKLLWNKINNS